MDKGRFAFEYVGFFYLWYTIFCMKDIFKRFKIEILFTLCTLVIIIFGFLSGIIYVMLVQREIVSESFARVSPVKQFLPVVMILPHQDDEMFMAGKFLWFIEQGHPVYMVLATDGGNSRILKDLQTHGYKNLDRQSFAHARNLEFFDSAKSLTVPEDHILFMNPGGVHASAQPLYQDGTLSEVQASEIVQQLYDKIGDGIYLTTSGGHPDHVALARALQNFSAIHHKLFFPIDIAQAKEKFFVTSDEQERKQKALGAYSVWDPEIGRYAIGERSVDPLIKNWGNGEFEYYLESL